MTSQYPWMFALDHDDRARCAQDLIDAARASFSTSQPHLAIAKLTSWRETAEAIAAGLGEEVVEWLDSDDENGATFIVRSGSRLGNHVPRLCATLCTRPWAFSRVRCERSSRERVSSICRTPSGLRRPTV